MKRHGVRAFENRSHDCETGMLVRARNIKLLGRAQRLKACESTG